VKGVRGWIRSWGLGGEVLRVGNAGGEPKEGEGIDDGRGERQ